MRLEQLAFPTLPPEEPLAGPRRLLFDVTQSGQGVFSYLTRSVTWSPRFILSAAGSNANLDALADRLEEAGGVDFESKPHAMGSGTRIFFVRDPDGYRIEFIERP